VLTGHSHSYERSFLINGVYGYGTSPNFVTPSFSTLQANGDILDGGNGNPAGDGAYPKSSDVNQGAVYVVAGTGGKLPEAGTGTHPVMVFTDFASNGSLLVDINGDVLTARFLRSDGGFTDAFSIDKSAGTGANQRPAVNAGADQTITLPSSASLNGTVTDDGLPSPPTLTTTWSKVSGPGTVTFGNANAVDTTATFSAAGTYVLRLTADDGALTNTDDVTITVNSSGSGTTARYRINAGGGSYTDSLGQAWSADQGFNTGTAKTITNAIAGTIDDPLFQSERWDPSTAPELQYSLSVPNGNYRVNLYFADTYTGTQKVGARVFDVLIEGSLRFDNLDIFAEAGGFTALTKTADVSVTDGVLNIEFRHVVENPKINAIEVLEVVP
jgi:hypothetical protein